MKVMAIIGSARKGNSFSMVQSIEDTLLNASVGLEVVHLKDFYIGFCDGCLSCDEIGRCHLDDDMSSIVEKVKDADGLVLASPARWSLLSGQMKVFMDRLNPLASIEALANKKAIIFVAGQTKEEEDNSISIAAESMVSFCDNAGIEVIDKVLAYGCLMENEVDEKTIKRCTEAAKRLVDSLK